MQNVITIDVAGFKRILDMMKSVISNKSALPILGDVKLDWDKQAGMFRLTGSNTDSWLTADCADPKTNDDGDIEMVPCVHMLQEDTKEHWHPVCLPYTDLRETFSLLPAARRCTVTFDESADGQRLMTIDYQDGQMSLSYDAADEYPESPTLVTRGDDRDRRREELAAQVAALQEQNSTDGLATLQQELAAIPEPICRFRIESPSLLGPVREARTCAANDELRPVMNGVCLDTFADHLVVVASDGHKFYKNVIETGVGYLDYKTFSALDPQTGEPGSAKLIVPKTVMATINAAFQQAINITVTADSRRLQFSTLGVNFVALCIEGKYPNYESVIPRDNPYKVQMSRDTLKMALRRVQLSADGSSNMATMLSDGTSFVIEASNMLNSKSGSERVPVQQTDAFLPEGFKIGMKISSTLDLLDLLDEDNIVFYFSDPSRAFLLRNESPKLQSKTLLQMPMLVNEA